MKEIQKIADQALKSMERHGIQTFHAAASACHKAGKHDDKTLHEVHKLVITLTVRHHVVKKHHDKCHHTTQHTPAKTMVVSTETAWHRQRKYAT